LSSLNGGGTPSTFGPGSLVFKSDGTLDVASSTIPAIKFKPAGNAADVSIKLDPGMGATGITSFATGNSALIRDQDGYTAGSLQRITVGRDGTIVGSFSNGTNQALAQVALASFNNPEGMERAGDNMYTVSANSGSPVIGYSGRETSSTIASGALEMSNVDLAQEFTEMIITQRGFQANGKMITTSDDMLQELVNLKR
ncbi:MAG: flagellar hook-basal body complex protein, partial [Gemmatimonadaceae bacterium]